MYVSKHYSGCGRDVHNSLAFGWNHHKEDTLGTIMASFIQRLNNTLKYWDGLKHVPLIESQHYSACPLKVPV